MLNDADRLRRIAERRRTRIVSWQQTTKHLAMLVSENIEAQRRCADIAARPLGFVHGILEQIRSEVGPNAVLKLEVTDSILVTISNPDAKRTRTFTLSEEDYEHDVERLAQDFARLFDELRVGYADRT